jgi:hypothetical protein
VDHIAEDDLRGGATDTADIRSIANALRNGKKRMPVRENVQSGREQGAKMREDVEVFALDDTVGLRAIGYREISRNVEKVTESSHDVTGEVGCVVAPQVESSAISSKNGEKRFSS